MIIWDNDDRDLWTPSFRYLLLLPPLPAPPLPPAAAATPISSAAVICPRYSITSRSDNPSFARFASICVITVKSVSSSFTPPRQ